MQRTQGILTKSDVQSFLQCPRKLWLEHHDPHCVSGDNPVSHRRVTDGHIVGEKAREQFGGLFLAPAPEADKIAAAEQARLLLTQESRQPATEVPVAYSGLYVQVDALIPDGDTYVLRETKASTFPLKRDKVTPDTPHDHHLNDVAIQAWALEGAGFSLARAELNLLDNQWRYPGADDYSGLFRQLDVTAEVQQRKNDVPTWLAEAHAVVSGDMPQTVTGKQCAEPYPCLFQTHCQKLQPSGPAHPIELLPDAAGKKLAKKLREAKGYTSILDPKPAELTGAQADLYRRIQAAHRTGKAILESGSDASLKMLPYPRYYFDFEGIDLPVPRWQGVRPYEQIPFQWSCHIEHAHGEFSHEEFLDITGNDPSLRCIERMREVISPDGDGPIFVYYSPYERGRLEELGKRHPEHSNVLQAYIARLFDLHPIVKQHFYHPHMRGSFSIKRVLPVIAPDLDYGELEDVQEGEGAQVAYLYAAMDPNTTAERKAKMEMELRKYCRLDTWAMVEVAYFLARRGRPIKPIDV